MIIRRVCANLACEAEVHFDSGIAAGARDELWTRTTCSWCGAQQRFRAAHGDVAETHRLDPGAQHIELLALIAELASSGDGTDTETLASATFTADQRAGRSAFRTDSPPWFGLRDPLEALEGEGLIEIDPGAAEFHAPDRPTPTARRLYLIVSNDGRAMLQQRRSAGGGGVS